MFFSKPQSVCGLLCLQYSVAEFHKENPDGLANGHLVLDQQDGFPSTIYLASRLLGLNMIVRPLTLRQVKAEGCSFARLAVDICATLILAYDAIDGSQPQAGALSS